MTTIPGIPGMLWNNEEMRQHWRRIAGSKNAALRASAWDIMRAATLDEARARAARNNNGWYYNQPNDPHCRAMGELLRAIGALNEGPHQ